MPSRRHSDGPRIPEESGGIQINFCRNPRCANFGVPASTDTQPRGPGAAERGRDGYTLGQGRGHRSGFATHLRCRLCHRVPLMKSNLAVSEELSRISSYLSEKKTVCCPNAECPNYGTDVRAGKRHYHSFGRTKSGSKRFLCRACGHVFSVGVSTLRQKKHHKNILVFSLLMNKEPFKRICEVAGIKPPTLYHKIDFLHRQCLAFAASRESRLAEGKISKWSLYVGVDHQDYIVNWKARDDKRNVQLSAIASAENATGYVFGAHLNFDPAMNPFDAEDETLELNDYEVDSSFRRHARVWLAGDYPQHETEQYSRRRDPADPEESECGPIEVMGEDRRLPLAGMQVHTEYTMFGHFFFLKRLFGKSVTKTRFYLDRDAGMAGACLAAFAEEIGQDRCHAFNVKITKGLSTTKKLRLINESLDELDDFMGRPRKGKKDKQGKRIEQDSTRFRSSPLSESDRAWYRQATLEKIKADLRTIVADGPESRRWIKHPLPNMGEPGKEVLHLTNTERIPERELTWLYFRASLHSVDNFFQQVRRRLSLLERPITSAAGRKWHGLNAYNPAMIVKLLDIFRVFYNYVAVPEEGDKKTPAMRMGLAKGPVELEKIIYYTPALSRLATGYEDE